MDNNTMLAITVTNVGKVDEWLCLTPPIIWITSMLEIHLTNASQVARSLNNAAKVDKCPSLTERILWITPP